MKIFARKTPWYSAGLAFECTGCGDCCAGPEEGYVWVTDEEIVAIAEHLNMSTEEVSREFVRKVGRRKSLVELPGSKDCVFLEPDATGGRRCRVYPVRPTQCRTWPFWPQNVATPDDWSRAAMRCAGINRGRHLHTLEEIEDNVRATRE